MRPPQSIHLALSVGPLANRHFRWNNSLSRSGPPLKQHSKDVIVDLVEGFGDGEHFVGAGADANVFGEIAPAHCAGGVDEEFGGAGDV